MTNASEPLPASRGTAWQARLRRAVQIRARVRQVRNRPAGADLSAGAAGCYLALFVAVLACIVVSNGKWNRIVNDTMLLISSLEMTERFSSLFSNANSNPLQALFDIHASGLRLGAIPNLVANVIFGPGVDIEFFYIFCGALLAFAVALMARAVGLSRRVAVLAGILTPLVLLPTFGQYPLADHFFLLWPISYYLMGGTVLITALFWRIGEGSWRGAALMTAAIILVLLNLAITQILFMTLMGLAMAAMGAGALVASGSRRALATKLVCAAVIVAVLTAAGIFHYLYAIGLNTASHVFYQELMDFMNFYGPHWPTIRDDIGRVIVNPFTYRYHERANFEGALVPLSQIGAVHLAIFGKTRGIRVFGRTMVVWVLLTALAIVVLHNFYYYTGRMYQGPDPRHFTRVLWPYYMICLATLVVALGDGVAAVLLRLRRRRDGHRRGVAHALIMPLLALPAGFIALNQVLGAVSPDLKLRDEFIVTPVPPFEAHARTALTDRLQSELGVALDRDYRGSAVFMPSQFYKDVKPYHGWRRESTFSYSRYYLQNDLGGFSLRHFNVPTLDQFTHNLTPHFYLVTRELLSRPGTDIYDKHFSLITRLNEPIMALLGVRYVIADYELPIGTPRLAMPIPEPARGVLESNRLLKSPVRLYEIRNANLGDYSPTQIVRADTAAAAITTMSDPGFDGRETLVTDDASIGNDLVRATGAAMTVRLGGVALRASSTGQSVLVLPVQFSHCWRIVSGSEATLFRANLLQLGVRFTGELRLELRQVFGPFWQSSCRLADVADVQRLRMVDALGAGGQRDKLPGDGINLIRTPEQLDRVIGTDRQAATITASPPGTGAPREFTLMALGGRTEHYVGLRLRNISPGPYTLSLQVRAADVAGIGLQLKDARGNGVLADYLLPTQDVWVHRLGEGDRRNATIRTVDDQWMQLTLTSTLTTEQAYLYFHVKDRRNGAFFSANGETVTIRAVKLERGELATPYSEPDQPDRSAQSRIPGDGVNLVRTAESLERVVSRDEASLQPVSPPGAAVREYRLSALGATGEHYVSINQPVDPGPHTVSLQVKPVGVSWLRLQLVNADGTGAIADYDLSRATTSMTGIVAGELQDAEARRVDQDWLSISLTANMQAGAARISIQLLGPDGSSGFAPRGEAVVLRGVMLERGETATPYPGLDR
jgi:hypothetical protein